MYFKVKYKNRLFAGLICKIAKVHLFLSVKEKLPKSCPLCVLFCVFFFLFSAIPGTIKVPDDKGINKGRDLEELNPSTNTQIMYD